MKLNNIQVKNAKPTAKEQNLSDGDNLYLHIAPTGTKTWRLWYRINGQRKRIVLGKYPIVTLAQAREAKLEYQRMVRSSGH